MKHIPNTDKKYVITTDGDIFSNISNKTLSLFPDKNGYLRVSIVYNGKETQFPVHRLVMLTYKPDALADMQEVNHIDGNKQNNKVNNLEWVTPLQNTTHAIQNGLRNTSGVKNPAYKSPIQAYSVKTGFGYVFHGVKSLQDNTFSHAHIYSCLTGKRKTHNGFTYARL